MVDEKKPKQEKKKPQTKEEKSQKEVKKKEQKPEEKKPVEQKKEPVKEEEKEKTPKEEKKQESKEEKKIKTTPKGKKTKAMVNITGVPISTKYAIALCNFVRYKKVETAIQDIEAVLSLKKAVPMKGEIPHRKGRIMSGRFPIRAAAHFKGMLKSLLSNAHYFGIEDPIISKAVANMGSRPYGRFGSIKRKRTHITLVAEKKKASKKKSKTKEKKK